VTLYDDGEWRVETWMDRSVMVETPDGARVGGIPYVSDGAVWLRDERKISRCLGMLPEDIPDGLRATLRAYGESEAESVGNRDKTQQSDDTIAVKFHRLAWDLARGDVTAREFREAEADAYQGADNPKEYRVVVVDAEREVTAVDIPDGDDVDEDGGGVE